MNLSNLVKDRLRGQISYGKMVDDNFPPGKYPRISFATRAKGHNAKEVPGFAVVNGHVSQILLFHQSHTSCKEGLRNHPKHQFQIDCQE